MLDLAGALAAVTADSLGFFEFSGWAFGVLSAALAVVTWRRQRTASAAAAAERRRSAGLKLLRALDEMDRQFAELHREHRMGHSQAAEAALRRWREAARSAGPLIARSDLPAVVDARRAIANADRRTQAMAGLGGSVNLGAKTMVDAIAEVDDCHRACAELRNQTEHAVYQPE